MARTSICVDRSSNPTGAPAGISKMNYLGQVSSIRWEDSEYLSMRKELALCPECALNMSTPVHSSHIHAGSVCVCGWFNVIHRSQRYQDADALYAFKNRGFGGEVGLSNSLGFTLSHKLVQILYLTHNQSQWEQTTQWWSRQVKSYS